MHDPALDGAAVRQHIKELAAALGDPRSSDDRGAAHLEEALGLSLVTNVTLVDRARVEGGGSKRQARQTP